MKPRTVTSPDQVIENIYRFQNVVWQRRQVQDRVARVWSWYAYKDDKSGAWKFAPGKFIGYRDANAENYLAVTATAAEYDGRIVERVLGEWFRTPERGSRLERELMEALRGFLAGFGKAPGKRARIAVLITNVAAMTRPSLDVDDLFSRVTSDPSICGGRPCIKGTRMRVVDIVEAIAHGAKREELLADFDYLTDDDITAALLYAARATGHRIVRTA